MPTPDTTLPKLAYLAHDLADAAVARRIAMLHLGGAALAKIQIGGQLRRNCGDHGAPGDLHRLRRHIQFQRPLFQIAPGDQAGDWRKPSLFPQPGEMHRHDRPAECP